MPIEMTGARRGDIFCPQTKADVAQLWQLPEGRMVKARFDKPRRRKDHRTFFRVIDKVVPNWPAAATGFEPRDSEHLRAWLLCKADHYDCRDFEPHSDDPREAAWEFALFLGGFIGRGDFFVRGTSKGLRVFKPRSISYYEADQAEFAPIREKVYADIVAITGVSIEEWKSEARMDSA